MFQSYKYIQYLGYNRKTNKHSHKYKIIDSEFEETEAGEVDEVGVEVEVGIGLEVALVQVYEKRGYSVSQVAKQLFLLFQYFEKEYGSIYYSIKNQIMWMKQYNAGLWNKYGKEIQKFLLF